MLEKAEESTSRTHRAKSNTRSLVSHFQEDRCASEQRRSRTPQAHTSTYLLGSHLILQTRQQSTVGQTAKRRQRERMSKALSGVSHDMGKGQEGLAHYKTCWPIPLEAELYNVGCHLPQAGRV